jgi:hypothetical protein
MARRRLVVVDVDENFIRVNNKYFNDVDRALEEIKKRIQKF